MQKGWRKVAKAGRCLNTETMSNLGKNLLTAGLSIIFKQDGYLFAPFKSQNIALNSLPYYRRGLEIWTCQVIQAEAAGIKPSALVVDFIKTNQ